ncbi:hypothetical protein EDD63_12916 [Breznakia blatticola]|uniref:Uncharacterized protein n=1 Tax=Breznakia blatticola TaxID=1754012 RepID=A0A4R7ZFJ6_9FIRM|nr:hypothetical protein [Breznakia blatticola]TDW16072.1 hypothetical protein EDD63_12916 [Breznakia blatticola]
MNSKDVLYIQKGKLEELRELLKESNELFANLYEIFPLTDSGNMSKESLDIHKRAMNKVSQELEEIEREISKEEETENEVLPS